MSINDRFPDKFAFAAFAILCVVVAIIFGFSRGEKRDEFQQNNIFQQFNNTTSEPPSRARAESEPAPESRRALSDDVHVLPRTDQPSAARESTAASNCIIRGRFLLPDGSPAAGVALDLHGWKSNHERVIQFGLPDRFDDLHHSTDAEGKFQLEFVPPKAYQFTLDTKLEHYGIQMWRWGEIAEGANVELGDIRLARGATIRGKVLNHDGTALGRGIHVYINSEYKSSGDGGDHTYYSAPADPATGEFTICDAPPGPADVYARGEFAWVAGPRIDVAEGAVFERNLYYDGPDPNKTIVVAKGCDLIYIFDEVDSIKLINSFGLAVAEQKTSTFHDVPRGEYTVLIEDPKFKTWSKSGVHSGERVRADLVGSSALRVNITDDAGGAIHTYRMRVRYHFKNMTVSPNEFEIRKPGDPEPANGIYQGIVPGDITIVVESEGYAHSETRIDNLMPGETKAITIQMNRGGFVHGRVTYATGDPARNVKITLASPDADDEILEEWEGYQGFDGIVPDALRPATTGADGSFSFTRVPAGGYKLVTFVSFMLRKQVSADVAANETLYLNISLPAHGFAKGSILGLRAEDVSRLRLEIYSTNPSDSDKFSKGLLTTSPILGPDNHYELGPAQTGDYSLVLSSIPEKEATDPRIPPDGVSLGKITIIAGTTVERNFEIPPKK
ncbi:MAG: carboxypeptidase regulatory-like domain-containing protein [Planctomycetes bacterium]|nr:carboxypeptidase regulatory-like domain-containing protein [Planctomycetota bacterium]